MKLKNILRWAGSMMVGGFLLFAAPFPASANFFAHHSFIMERVGDMRYSPLIEGGDTFNTVVLKLNRTATGVAVNFNPLGGGKWEPVEIHNDGFGPQALLFTSPSHLFQLKQLADDGGGDLEVAADTFFASDEESASNDPVGGPSTEDMYSGPQIVAAGIQVIRRQSWGADENLRYWTPETEELLEKKIGSETPKDPCADMDSKYSNETKIKKTVSKGPSGEDLIWPLAYTDGIKKIIVHHTDSDLRDMNGDQRTDSLDYKAMVRAIYYFHAISRGWGDIGYNYLIDPLGNVYEGRFGGDGVIGAHAQCFNNGALGIAIIGNYEENEVPQPTLNSLNILIAQKAKQFGIDPQAESTFRGVIRPNILGHKDVRPTSCPGKKLYVLLPDIRARSASILRSATFSESALSAQTLDYNAEPVNPPSTLSLNPNERKKVTLRFKNTGLKTWDSNTWLHVSLNKEGGARVVPIIEDKIFVAANMKEVSVPPGGSATFHVDLEADFKAGWHSFEVAPVINGRYRVSKATVLLSFQVNQPFYDYEIISQKLPSGTVFQGQNFHGEVVLKNTGNVKWVNYGEHPIRMGTEELRDRRSLLVKTSTTRVAHLLESEVPPGKTGTFLFELSAPLNFQGDVKERFSPVIEYVSWLEDKKMGFEVSIKKPNHAAKVLSKTSVSDMLPGEAKKISISLQNTGDLVWDSETLRVTLVARGLSVFTKFLRPTKAVEPGASTDFEFWLQAPYQGGAHTISFLPRFGRLAVRGGTVRFVVNVPDPSLRARRVTQSDRSFALKPNQEKQMEVSFKNLGNTVWRKKGENAVFLAPTQPQDRLSQFFDEKTWPNRFRAANLVEDEVRPGETGTFRFTVQAPVAGSYKEYFQLVMEKIGWMDGSLVRWDVEVSTSASSASLPPTVDPLTAAAPLAHSPPSPPSLQPFRLRLSYGADMSELTADRAFSVKNEKGETLFFAKAGDVLSVERSDQILSAKIGVTVKNASVVRLIPEAGGVTEIRSMERRPAWNLSLNDNQFRGTVEVRSVNGETAFINELPLEDYLKGLAEVSNDTPTEKQKAIAVLARTYARFYMDPANRKFPGLPYDGSDDPAIFQRYLGYGVEKRAPNFTQSVIATANKIVTYNSQLIKTPYFSQSDGKTRSAQEVWGWTNTPYLQSVDDPYCKGLTLQGHGVGMSGCGAEGMAKAGKTYEEIIRYYYQGVEIKELL